MSQAAVPSPRQVPTWIVVAGSVAICFHLGVVAVNVLAAPSGPWPGPEGPAPTEPPAFAQNLNVLAPTYLAGLKINPNYRFESNRPEAPGVYFIARVKDAAGSVVATVRVPDPDANPWVRYREGRLAQWLGQDMMVPPPQAPKLPAPGQQPSLVTYWKKTAGEHTFQLVEEPEHLVDRRGPAFQPSPMSLLMARSYTRFLCRAHGGTSVEIERHMKAPIPLSLLFPNANRPDANKSLDPITPTLLSPPEREALEENTHSFGELRP
jgi:hypothetical protein